METEQTRFDVDFDRIFRPDTKAQEIQRELDANNAKRARRDGIDYRRLSEEEMRGAN